MNSSTQQISPQSSVSKRNSAKKEYDLNFSGIMTNQAKADIPQKNWWIHIWSGLVLEKQAKHYKSIHQAIWLYLYLLLVANRRTGQLYRKLSTVASETGFHPRSIARWLKHLRETGYIETYSTGRFLHIAITKWKPLGKRSDFAGKSGKAKTIAADSNKSHHAQ